MKHLFRILFILLASVLALLLLLMVVIQIPAVQSEVASKVMERVNEQFGTQVKIGKVNINYLGNVKLYQVTAKDHRNYEFINIPQLTAEISWLDLYRNSNHVNINAATLVNPRVDVFTYLGEEKSNFIKFIDKFILEDSTRGDSEFVLRGNLEIQNGKLKIINHNLVQNSKVWLDANRLNARLEKISVEGKTYIARIKKLRFDAVKNREKYQLKDLTTNFKMTDKGLFFNDLNLETQSSHLNGFLHLTYDHISQFSNFSDGVEWNAKFTENNKFAYKDLRYFVPNWQENQVFSLSGEVKGFLNNLSLKKFSLKNKETYIDARYLNFQNLMKDGFSLSGQDLNLATSYTELKQILPQNYTQYITDFIARFGKMSYVGNFSLDGKYLRAKGFASTKLGDGQLDLVLSDYSGNHPHYQGSLNTDQFHLGALAGTENLGKVSGNIRFDGRGYDLDLLDVDAVGKLNYLEFNNNRFNHINFDGKLAQRAFKGFLAINDSQKARLNYQGIFDFSAPQLKMDFNSKIDYLNLNYFGISKTKNTWISGDIEGVTNFSEINDLSGEFKIQNLTFNSDTVQMNLPKSNVSVYQDELQQKNIDANIPGYLSGKIIGKFHLDELGVLFENGVGNFMVNYEHKQVNKNQYLNYVIKIESDLLKFFVPESNIQPNSLLVGTLNNDEKIFEVDFKTPQVKYQNYIAQNLHFLASTSIDKSFSAKADKIEVQGINVEKFNFEGKTKSDTLLAKAHFFTGENLYGEYDLNFYQTYDANQKIKIGFSPSTIKFDEQVWNINQFSDSDSNYAIIDFEKNNYDLVEILLNSEEQFLKINANYVDDDNFKLQADVNKVKLEKAIPNYYLGDLGLRGTVNGKLNVTKSNNSLRPIADIVVDSIYLKEQYVGRFVADAEYSVGDNLFNINGSLDRNEINTLILTGAIDNKGEKPQLDLLANFDDFNVNLMDAFLSDILSQWKGEISGEVAVKGDVGNPSFIGNITTRDLGFRVVYLGTYYTLIGENEFDLNKQPGQSGLLDLAQVEIIESTSKTKAMVDGSLIFSSISDWFLDLEISSDRVMVMNTTVADNELFYGKAFVQGELYMFGPAADLEVSTGFDAKVLKGSIININTGGTKTIGENKFIQFYSYDESGQLVESEKNSQKIQGFSMDLVVDVDDKTIVNLVLDEKSNDVIQAQGFAENFEIAMNKAGNLSINGDYNITDGIYSYREGIIINKDFDIEKGGFIRFTGDPYNAQMNIKAVYSRNVNNIGTYLGINYVQPTVVDLIIGVNGDLKNTQINLDLETPETSTQVKNLLSSKLRDNPDEKIRQVGSILVLGRFDSSETIGASTATDAAAASAFELLSKQVGNVFSNIIPGLEINPTYLQSSDSRNQSDKIQTEFNLAINKRLSINGAVGTPLGSQYNERITTQLELDYDISKAADGGLRFRAFSRPSTIGLENYNVNVSYTQSYGAGIVYRKSFYHFRDLFTFKKAEQEKNISPIKEESAPRMDSIKEESRRIKDSLKQRQNKKDLSFLQFK